MKKTALMFALAAACLTSGASAQSYQYQGDRHERPLAYGDDYRDERRDYRDERRDYRAERREYREERRRDQRYRRARGAGPHHDIYRGERLPQAYWGTRYVVRNYERYDLPMPAPGHRWLRVGNDFVSSSVHTGIIGAVVIRR